MANRKNAEHFVRVEPTVRPVAEANAVDLLIVLHLLACC
jgi:hypothetical protein